MLGDAARGGLTRVRRAERIWLILPNMKKVFAPASVLLIAAVMVALTATTKAGSFGPGPWANGAYYPGQFDGVYSATVFGNNTSGVFGFALQAGSPTIITNSESTTTTNISVIQSTVIPDPWQNYFLIFFNGVTYYGTTFATINVNASSVAGAMYDGRGVLSETNFSYASGGFTASLTSDKSPVTFTGNNTGQLQIVGGAGTLFSLNGIKVSDISSTSGDGNTAQ